MKSVGRPDLLYSIPKVLIKGFTNQRAEMLKLTEIAAAKEKYGKAFGIGSLINHVDQGARLSAKDIYQGMADKGWVVNTETGLREFVNQVGQYEKRLQPTWTRWFRDTQVQPFATAIQAGMASGMRALVLSPAAKATSFNAALALKADMAGSLIGVVALVASLNYILAKKQNRPPSVSGPPGTKIGNIGWLDEEGKLRQFNVLGFTGWGRGLQQTGVAPAIEANRLGLTPTDQAQAALRGSAQTAINYAFGGPANRTLSIAMTGSRPGLPMVKEAPTVPPPPTDEFAPLKSQMAANIGTALQQANPIIDAAVSAYKGRPMEEIVRKQLRKYAPSAGTSVEKIEAMPQIVHSAQIKDYADDVAKEARKLPIHERAAYIFKRFEDDQVQSQDIYPIQQQIRKRGVFQYQ